MSDDTTDTADVEAAPEPPTLPPRLRKYREPNGNWCTQVVDCLEWAFDRIAELERTVAELTAPQPDSDTPQPAKKAAAKKAAAAKE